MSDHLCLIEFLNNPLEHTARQHAETVYLALGGMGIPN